MHTLYVNDNEDYNSFGILTAQMINTVILEFLLDTM